MKRKQKPKRFIKRIITPPCRFCNTDTSPDYKKWEVLSHYVTDRGKIYPAERSGACTHHQRLLAKNIKYARHLALLPYIVRPL
jgi:small subunit ribosomal protein S18